MALRIGIDTGGTFTDFVVFDGEHLRVHKVRSTPQDPTSSILQGLSDLVTSRGSGTSGTDDESAAGGEAREVVHGSTVATNALLERKGARVALVTTEGFEDILLIGRQTRRDLYDPFVRAPLPIVSADHSIGLAERVLADGSVARALEPGALDALVARVREIGADAVAVCLLHAYANPAHERLVTARLAAEGYPVSASHEILSEYREFERCSTTAVNAYVTPLMSTYLSLLEQRLAGDMLRVMQSNGGAISAAAASRAAVQTVLSGPAGGVVGAAAIGAAAGFPRIITFDMGGTSTDVSLVDGVPALTTEAAVGDFPIRVPLLDIHTVGAGGGSIAYVDAGGALRVGPESAGADPGPACYGRGGRPTVTDANLLLGRIDPERFLGGRMRVDAGRARASLEALAAETGLDVMAIGEGIVRVANANMERAIRVVSVERGFDPRDFALVPFGGAGGLHACAIASTLDIQTILVPAHPGVLSALGLLLSDTICDFSNTLLTAADDLDAGRLEQEFEALARSARARLAEDGFAAPAMRVEWSADVRYVGQAYEINVPVSPGDLGAAGGSTAGRRRPWPFVDAFHAAHERLYGYADAERPVELVNVRVRGIGSTTKPPLPDSSKGTVGRRARPVAERELFADGQARVCPVFDRSALQPGAMFTGPALAVDEGSTTFIAPGWSGRTDDMGNLVLTAQSKPSAGRDE